MTEYLYNNRLTRAEPLPDSFERELAEIDALLAQHASSMGAPAGLAERVFRASAGLLRPASIPMVIESASSKWHRRRAFAGRLAMAASVAAAFVLAARFNVDRPSVVAPEPVITVASISPLSPAEEVLLLDRVNEMGLGDSNRLVEYRDDRPSTIESIVEASGMNIAELSSDLMALEASLEM